MKQPRRILLISPVFHDYWRSIARGFEANGHSVLPVCYDHRPSVTSKVRSKLTFEALDFVRPGSGIKRFELDATNRVRRILRTARADAVVIIKGDLLRDEFWDDLVESGVPHVLWLYDEVRRMRHPLERFNRLQHVVTYSPEDLATLLTHGVNASLCPNAFDPTFADLRVISDEVLFIGARYPERTAVLEDLAQRGVAVRAVGKDWSHRPFDRLRTWSWSRPDIPWSGSVSRPIATAMMGGAAATLNIHGDQDGFTMRTFEASGVGALQLIDRSDVGDFYEPGVEILAFETTDEVVELLDRARRDRPWAEGVRAAAKARTLAEHTFAHRARVVEALWD